MTILENKPKGHIYGLMGNINITTFNNNISIIKDYKFKGTVKEYLNNSKDISSLKMVELKRISLAKALIENKDYIILDYFEKELNHTEREYFKRLWKKLSNEYNKTIVIFTNDIRVIWDIVEELIIVDKYQVINTIPKSNYDLFIDNLNKPEIFKLIDLIKTKGIPIENYQDPKELLKAIYRIKENS